MIKTSRQKVNYIKSVKSFQDEIFIIFKDISLKQIEQFFLQGESPTLIHPSKSDFRIFKR